MSVTRGLLSICTILWIAVAARFIGGARELVLDDLGLPAVALGLGAVCGMLAAVRHQRGYRRILGTLLVVFSLPAATFLFLYQPP